MKKATLLRQASTDQGTPGILTFGTSASRTIELPWRDNTPQRSCIPCYTYTCVPFKSAKFGSVYHVTDVPGRSAVLIHSANFAGDVELGWTTQLHGCIAPCCKLGIMTNNAGNKQLAGLVSRPALNALLDWAAGELFELEIKNAQ